MKFILKSFIVLTLAISFFSCSKSKPIEIPREAIIRGKIINVDDHRVYQGGPVVYRIKTQDEKLVYLAIPSTSQIPCEGTFQGAGRNPEDTVEVRGMLFNNVISICEAPEYYLKTVPRSKASQLLFWKKNK